MENLSAAAIHVLTYVNNHAIKGYAEIGNDIGLPDKVVITACENLKACGIIINCCSSFSPSLTRMV